VGDKKEIAGSLISDSTLPTSVMGEKKVVSGNGEVITFKKLFDDDVYKVYL